MRWLPQCCWGCQAPLLHPVPSPALCECCNLGVEPLDPGPQPREDGYALYPYDAVLAGILAQLKLQRRRPAARPLGELLWQAPRHPLADPGRWDYLTAMPLHPRRLRERGFNQCELILHWAGVAAYRQRRIRLPDRAPGLLVRITDTPAQRTLDRAQRARNVQDAFAVDPRAKIDRNARILLMDDVKTTGATLRAALSALRAAGYAHCEGLSLMHADREAAQLAAAGQPAPLRDAPACV